MDHEEEEEGVHAHLLKLQLLGLLHHPGGMLLQQEKQQEETAQENSSSEAHAELEADVEHGLDHGEGDGV